MAKELEGLASEGQGPAAAASSVGPYGACGPATCAALASLLLCPRPEVRSAAAEACAAAARLSPASGLLLLPAVLAALRRASSPPPPPSTPPSTPPSSPQVALALLRALPSLAAHPAATGPALAALSRLILFLTLLELAFSFFVQ